MSYGTQQYGGSQYGQPAAQIFARTYIESVEVGEARVLDISMLRAETTSFSGAFSRTHSSVRTFSETAAFDEVYSDVYTGHRSFNELASFSDAYETLLKFVINVQESASFSDSSDSAGSFRRSYSEDMFLDSFFSRTGSYGRDYNESFFTHDTYSSAIGIFRSYSEDFGFSDEYETSYTARRLYNESSEFGDALNSLNIAVVRTEKTGFDDVFRDSKGYFRTYSDAADFSDSGLFDVSLLLNEDLNVSESYNRLADLSRSYQNVFGLDPSFMPSRLVRRFFSEIVSANTDHDLVYRGRKNWSEKALFDDFISFHLSKRLSETLKVEGSVDYIRILERTYTESAAFDVSDLISLLRNVESAELSSSLYEESTIETDVFEANSVAADLFEEFDVDAEFYEGN